MVYSCSRGSYVFVDVLCQPFLDTNSSWHESHQSESVISMEKNELLRSRSAIDSKLPCLWINGLLYTIGICQVGAIFRNKQCNILSVCL